jgi:hypothetical protein
MQADITPQDQCQQEPTQGIDHERAHHTFISAPRNGIFSGSAKDFDFVSLLTGRPVLKYARRVRETKQPANVIDSR